MSFQDKLVLITGASRGIGKAIALEFAKANAIVVGTATTPSGAESINAYLKEHNARGMGIQLNITNTDDIDAALKNIQAELGKSPDILVNNAGITQDNILLRLKDEQWEQVIDTNLTGVFRMTKRCIRGMLKNQWGRVITVGSVSGIMGNLGQANYAAAKAGVIGFSKSLAIELASRGITVNVVAPGFVDTDMTSSLKPEQVEACLSEIPVGRFAKPEEIAKTVTFLASEDSGYITGETININGGIYMN